MTEDINYISFGDKFWIRFGSEATSFSFEGVPSKVHFTIAYNKNSPDINFHVTCNFQSQTDKPKIEIVRINKQLLEQFLSSSPYFIFNTILQPLDIRRFHNRSGKKIRKARYISFDQLNKSKEYNTLEKGLTAAFRKNSVIKNKTRLKVQESIEGSLRSFARSPKIENILFSKLKRMPRRFSEQNGHGFIVSKEYCGNVIRINGKWFTIKQGVTLIEFLSVCMPTQLAKHLAFKTTMAIARVEKATSFEETKKYNCSVKLSRNTM